jgi:gluconolactonase
MFFQNPPSIRPLEDFTRLPDRFRRDEATSWAAANRGGAPTHSFLEGPVLDAAGNLYVTDIPYGRIFRIDPAGAWSLVAEYEGEPNGMKLLGDRELLVTDYRNGLVAIDIATGAVRDHLTRRNSERFKGVNDLTWDAQGNLYFTDQGQTGLHDPTGRVYRLGRDGSLDLLIANAPSPNGIVLSNDQKFLFVAMTRGNCVWRMPLMADGSVSKAGQFFTSYGPSGPDGLAMDAKDRLIVCNPGLGCAWVLDAFAEPVEILEAGRGVSLTNVALHPSGVAYFTDSTHGRILRAQL